MTVQKLSEIKTQIKHNNSDKNIINNNSSELNLTDDYLFVLKALKD